MKLKKLIPLAGITGIAAVAAPLATSCATKGTEIIWEAGDEIKITPAKAKSYDPTEEGLKQLNEDYFTAINNDKTLLTNEILYSNTYMISEVSSSLQLQTASARVDKADLKTKKVSYTASASGEYVPLFTNASVLSKEKFGMETTVKNLAYGVMPDEMGISTVRLPIFAPQFMVDAVIAQMDKGITSAGKLNLLVEEIASKYAADKSWYVDVKFQGIAALYNPAVINGNYKPDTPKLFGDINLHIDYTNIIDLLILLLGSSTDTQYGAGMYMLYTLGSCVASKYLENVTFNI